MLEGADGGRKPLNSRRYLNLATLVAGCIGWRKKQTQRARHIHHQKSPSAGAVHGRKESACVSFALSIQLVIAPLNRCVPWIECCWAMLGVIWEKCLWEVTASSQITTGATSREPPSVPIPRFVLPLPGSQHLLYPIACSEAGTSLVAINLAAGSFSTRVLYLGLINDEKSSSLGLCHPQSLRMRRCEQPTFIKGLLKWAERH